MTSGIANVKCGRILGFVSVFLAFLGLLPAMHPQVATVSVGANPIAVAVNANTNKIYVANQGSDSVSVIDGTTNTVTATIALSPTPANGARSPRAIAVNSASNLVYVADEASQDLAVINGNADVLAGYIPLPHHVGTTVSEFHPDALTINPGMNQIYIGSAGCQVAVLDGATGSVSYPSVLCGGTAIAANTNTGHFFIAYHDDSDVEDRDSNLRRDSNGFLVRNLLIDSLASDFACPSSGPRPAACSNCSSVPCVINYSPQAIVADVGTGKIYVANNLGPGFVGAVRVITDSNIPTLSDPVLAGGDPYSIALNPNTHHVYVANQGLSGATVTVVEGTTAVATVPVGSSAGPAAKGAPSCGIAGGPTGPTVPAPNKIGVDTVDDLILVANECSNNVTVIDGPTNNLVTTLPVGNYPFAVAYDSANNDTYVANFGSGSVSVFGAPSRLPAVSISTNSLTFGSQEAGTTSAGQIVTVSNNGTGDLFIAGIMANTTMATVQGSSDYAESDPCGGLPLHAGSSCSILVTFTPHGGGASTGTLTIDFVASNPIAPAVVNLSGTGTVPSVTFSPSSLEFGSLAVNTFSAVQPVTITNHTAADIKAFFSASNGFNEVNDNCGFDPITADSIVPAGQSCTLELQFTPTMVGPITGNMLLIDDFTNPRNPVPITDSKGDPYSIALSGIGTDGSVQLLPSSLTFGSQAINTASVEQVITITNRKLLEIHFSSLQLSSAEFGIDSENCTVAPVALGTSCEISVKFVAAATGIRVGQLTITDRVNNLQLNVPLSGFGTAPGVVLSPSSLSFGMQVLGNLGPAQAVTIINTDPANPLVISAVKFVSDGGAIFATTADNCSPASGSTTTLNALGGSCTIQVTFTSNGFQRALSGQIVIFDSSPDSPHVVTLTGLASNTNFFTVTPPSLDFIGAGTTAVIFNDTLLTPDIRKVATVGDYSDMDNCSPSSSSCAAQVTFAPTAGGIRNGQLTIDDANHPEISPAIVALSGSTAPAGANTPQGNVLITPIAQNGTTPVTVIFDNVTQPGQTSLNVMSAANCPTPPSGGFELGSPAMCYDISTTAQFSGQATVCINYTGTNFSSTSLALMHYEAPPAGNGWTDRTFYKNPAQNLICARVSSFSPFEIFAKASNQAPLTVIANDVSRQYSSPDPTPFKASYNGFLNGDDSSSLSGQLVCVSNDTASSPVGSYTIDCSSSTLSSPKYAISYKTGTLTVTPAPLTLAADNKNKTYGAALPVLTFTPSGFVNGDSVNSLATQPTLSTTAAAASGVGIYAISISGAMDPNYTITYVQGTLSVNPAVLTITAKGAAKVLDAPNPTFDLSPSGFVNGDGVSVLTPVPTCHTTATTNSPVGSYPIACAGGSAANYALTYVPGTLKILYATAIGHMIEPPISADGSSVLKQGRTVPAKFSVYDANGVSIGTPGVVSSFYLTGIRSGTVTTPVQDVVDTNNPDPSFRFDGQHWIFNITTANLVAGSTLIYTITLKDGSTIVFQFGLR